MASPTAYTPTFQGLMDLSPSLVIPPIHPIIWVPPQAFLALLKLLEPLD